MTEYLVDNPHAGYRFLPGSDPYSSGVIAKGGHEIVNCRLLHDLPWREGLTRIRKYLEANGWGRHDICAIELRCPRPLSLDEFGSFNREYFDLLSEWDMIIDGQNPVARTNVAPIVNPPDQIMLHAVSHLWPSAPTNSFVVSGGGELPHRSLERERIVRVGETSPDAIREKVDCVVRIMQTRLKRLGADLQKVSRIAAYCGHDWSAFFEPQIIAGLPNAAAIGVNWFYARPPVQDIEFEMDIHGVYRHELV